MGMDMAYGPTQTTAQSPGCSFYADRIARTAHRLAAKVAELKSAEEAMEFARRLVKAGEERSGQ